MRKWVCAIFWWVCAASAVHCAVRATLLLWPMDPILGIVVALWGTAIAALFAGDGMRELRKYA